MKKLRFIPGDTNYRWDFRENSPFLKRSLTVFSHDEKIKAKSLVVRKRYYDLFFSNEKEAYQSRNQTVLTPDKLQIDKQYIEVKNLSGNIVQIQFSMNKLLEKLIVNFEEDPQTLFIEAAKIEKICHEEGYQLSVIEAFYNIRDWEEFMDLLNSLHQSKGPFKFELMIAAVTQYAALCR